MGLPDVRGSGISIRVGIAVDHGGFHLKGSLISTIKHWGFNVVDFGAERYENDDDFPDYVIPLCQAIAKKEIDRGIAVCGSGIGVSIVANKVHGVRAASVSDIYSAHQGVEDDDMNVICLGARVIGDAVAIDLVQCFLYSQFSAEERFQRRIAKIKKVEEE